MTSERDRAVLISGGAGFIGTNLAARLLAQGERVIAYDNLSRPGVEKNVDWLIARGVEFVHADVRNRTELRRCVEHATAVYHFAAQVAVTTSLEAPVDDFEVNAIGTLNVLEEVRALRSPVPLVFTSTNKVYGDLGDMRVRAQGSRYAPEDATYRRNGIGEDCPLGFHSPYGCSKGAADQYVLDYARSYGLPGVVFRMSCIYGPHQFGTEDQGWVAHFLIKALRGEPITIYGDGLQVRDILFVEDLVDAFLLARRHIDKLAGQAFNMGGGPDRTVSLRELMAIIAEITGSEPRIRSGEWRVGDQRYYVSNTSRFQEATGWRARVGVCEGVSRLHEWLTEASPALEERAIVQGSVR